MPDTTQPTLYASRLVRQLTRMGIPGTSILPERFAERAGALLDLSGAVTLSKTLAEPIPDPMRPSAASAAAIRDTFLKERSHLVQGIVKRFVPPFGTARNRLPSANELHAHCLETDAFASAPVLPNCDAAFAPYRKHYLTLHGRLATASQRQRLLTVEAIAGLSPMLAGLAALDKGLGEAFYHRQRLILDRIPTLLERHFRRLLQTRWQALPERPRACDLAPWLASGGWIHHFCGQMQELLLAELDIRLQPAMGLIETALEIGTHEQCKKRC